MQPFVIRRKSPLCLQPSTSHAVSHPSHVSSRHISDEEASAPWEAARLDRFMTEGRDWQASDIVRMQRHVMRLHGGQLGR